MLLRALLRLNILWLKQHPNTPSLYSTGVRYKRDPEEEWLTIPFVIRQGYGDCEDLACWRVAELRRRGEHARLRIVEKRMGNKTLFHILVRRANGKTEDPSRRLGME